MRKRHIITGIITGSQPLIVVAALMTYWGNVHWGLVLTCIALGVPLGVITARNAAFREQFPDFEKQDFERRSRGWQIPK